METQQRIDQNRVILGASSPFSPDVEGEFYDRFLGHIKADLEPLIAGKNVVFLPYAERDMDYVTNGIDKALKLMGARSVISTHQFPGRETSIIGDGEAIYIHGGNTGRLVANLHALTHEDDGTPVDQRPGASRISLVDAIRNKVADGTPLIGVSAGLNVMAYDTRTTNDMSAAARRTENGLVARLDSLALFPPHLNFNPHYPPRFEDKTIYIGENREERIAPVLEMDHGRKVLALREGAYILARGMEMRLEGTMGGVLFEYGKEPQELGNGDISHLLNLPGSS